VQDEENHEQVTPVDIFATAFTGADVPMAPIIIPRPPVIIIVIVIIIIIIIIVIVVVVVIIIIIIIIIIKASWWSASDGELLLPALLPAFATNLVPVCLKLFCVLCALALGCVATWLPGYLVRQMLEQLSTNKAASGDHQCQSANVDCMVMVACPAGQLFIAMLTRWVVFAAVWQAHHLEGTEFP